MNVRQERDLLPGLDRDDPPTKRRRHKVDDCTRCCNYLEDGTPGPCICAQVFGCAPHEGCSMGGLSDCPMPCARGTK